MEEDQDTTKGDIEQPTGGPAVDPALLLSLIDQLERTLAELKQLALGQDLEATTSRIRRKAGPLTTLVDEEGARIIEGVFDGQNMVGPDGKQYSVPANYASKSKLVEGDVLKLTITRDGSFIYKQIGPVERQRLIGQLTRDETTGEYRVVTGGRSYKILLASVTYFKGEIGDEVVVLVPEDGDSRWSAVENIIKKPATEEVVV